MKTAMNPTVTVPQPTWRSLSAWPGRPPCPPRAPRARLLLRGAAVRTPGKGLHDGGGDAAGRARSGCTACQPDWWMVGHPPANASVREGGSLPPTPTGGVRFYLD
jgi:hypothetical protein